MKVFVICFSALFILSWIDNPEKTWKEYLVGILFLFTIIYIKKMGVI